MISESSRQENTVYQTGRDGSKTPYVTHTLSAKVEGVTVLAQGGDSSILQKNITEVIEALFDIEPHKIKVAKKMCIRDRNLHRVVFAGDCAEASGVRYASDGDFPCGGSCPGGIAGGGHFVSGTCLLYTSRTQKATGFF